MADRKPRAPDFGLTRFRQDRIWRSALLAALFLLTYYVLRFGIGAGIQPGQFERWHQYLSLLEKLSLSLFVIMVILLIGGVVERFIESTRHSHGTRYNLVRITRLVSFILVAIVILSFLFQNLYAAAVSFGLISLVVGFALQAPITSFIAWLYIIFRVPYQVGDRIQLGEQRGDVVQISYLDTIMMECSGSYLGNDRASGRLIHFPNSIVLRSEVINYSGQFRPFIWNETPLQIAYTSDLPFVEACLKEAADKDLAERHPEWAKRPQYAAEVYFRVNGYAWLEAVVSYPVAPTDTTGRRNRILRAALPALNREPDKVQFPHGTQR